MRAQLRKQTRVKALLRGISLSEYGSEGFRVRLRRLSEYGSVAYLVERPTRETQAEQYSDTVLNILSKNNFGKLITVLGKLAHLFGKLVRFCGKLVNKLVHIFAWKLVPEQWQNFETSFEKFGATMATGGLEWH